MKKNIIYIMSVLLLGTMAFTSCKGYLDPDDKKNANQTAEGILSTNPEYLRVYAYSLLKPIVSRVDVYEEGVDLYMSSNKKNGTQFDQYTITPENAAIKTFYADLYACINMANACLNYDAAGKYAAEMKFVRSYCYYILTQQFGSVPYITEYINNANRSYPKTPLKDIYEALIAELQSIKDDANLDPANAQGYASSLAVKALLAKVYLAAGWDLNVKMEDALKGTYTVGDKKYFTEALAAAEKVIDGKPITMSFEDKWSPSHEGNAEVIFAVRYQRAGFPGDEKTGGHGLQNTFGSYYGDCAGTGEKYVNGLHASNPKSSYLWDARDERYDATFMTTMYNSLAGGWGNEGYYAYYNVDDLSEMPIAMRVFPGTASISAATAYQAAHADQLEKGECVNDPQVIVMSYPTMWVNGADMEYYSFVGTTPGMFAAPVVKKFDDPASQNISTNMTNDYRDIVVLHLSEIYLVAAEAALMAGEKGTAEGYINDVRQRGYGDAWNEATDKVTFASYQPAYATPSIYPTFTLADIDLVLDERARELYAEGYRWMDLRRTKQLVRYTSLFNHEIGTVAKERVKWYRPIPQAEINANEAITDKDQNEGY